MKSNFKNAQVRTSVMEAETISKNGASPKSQTSRRGILSGMRRSSLFLAIALAFGTARSFGQFNSMGDLYQWLNQQNQQSQQMMNQAMNALSNALQTQAYERVKNLRVNEDKSYTYKDKETGKYGGEYGAVIILEGGVVDAVKSLSPVKVRAYGEDKNGKNYSIDITDECIYAVSKIIVPPLFAKGYLVGLSVESNSSYKIEHGNIAVYNYSWYDDKATENYEDYARELQIHYEAVRNTIQMQSGASPIPYGGSTGGSTTGGASTYTETCSGCNGTGYIIGSRTPTYGNTGGRWCSECNKHVNDSHSHDQCPSCRGLGYKTRIR